MKYYEFKDLDVEEIEGYLRDNGRDFFDTDPEEEVAIALKIEGEYFIAVIEAELESTDNDLGDRTYFIEKIGKINYEPTTYEEVRNLVNRDTLQKVAELKAEIQVLADSLLK